MKVSEISGFEWPRAKGGTAVPLDSSRRGITTLGACLVRLTLLAGLAIVVADRAEAAIFSTTGALTEISAPPSFMPGALESSTEFYILDEGITVLPGDVIVNAFGVGVHTSSVASLLTIPMGTPVHSYIVHFDPLGAGFAKLSGTVFFDPGELILGIQTHSPLLDFTDAVTGHPTPIYPTGTATRGFDGLPSTDTVTIAPGLGSATFALFAELGIDQARIFTVPEPSSSLLLVLGAVSALGMAHRRRV